MKPYGFPNRLVRTAVSSLLKDGLIEANPDGPDEAIDTVSSPSGTGIQLPINGVDTVSAKTASELPIEPANQLLIKAASETPIRAEKESEFQPDWALAENHVSKSPQLGTGLSDKRYKPSHGWISNDFEKEDELIELSVAPWLSGVN